MIVYIEKIAVVVFTIYGISFLPVWLGCVISFFKKEKNNREQYNFSVIIPYRNERETIPKLIESLKKVNYPKEQIEFIFVNDHSEDHSAEILNESLTTFQYAYQVLELSQDFSGKKRALDYGIQNAHNEIILATDADCVFQSSWVYEMNKAFTPATDFVIGPVINKASKGLLEGLQEIESLMLTSVTIGTASIGKPVLCSGANLAFRKEFYEKLKPFDDNYSIASGDDMFFLQKAKKLNSKLISYQDSMGSVVETTPANRVKEMINRSIRWAGKSSKLKSLDQSFFGAIVLITNYSFLLLALLCFFYFEKNNIFLKLCGLKVGIDLVTYFLINFKYQRFKTLVFLPLMVVYYPLYLLLISVMMIFTKPAWKSRNV